MWLPSTYPVHRPSLAGLISTPALLRRGGCSASGIYGFPDCSLHSISAADASAALHDGLPSISRRGCRRGPDLNGGLPSISPADAWLPTQPLSWLSTWVGIDGALPTGAASLLSSVDLGEKQTGTHGEESRILIPSRGVEGTKVRPQAAGW